MDQPNAASVTLTLKVLLLDVGGQHIAHRGADTAAVGHSERQRVGE